MKINILVIGDPHFKEDNKELTDLLSVNILDILDESKIDLVIILGDIMHYGGRGDMKTFIRCCNFLSSVAKKTGKDNCYLLIGNHDRLNNSSNLGDEHWFNPLKDCDNFATIVGDIMFIDRNGLKFGLVPYIQPGKLMDNLNESLKVCDIKLEDIATFFMHQEIRGGMMGNKKSTKGDFWDESYPDIISGHLHKKHKPQKNVLYVGTPYQINFGDSGDKFIHIFSYERADDGHIEKRIKNIKLKFPQKICLKMSAEEFNKHVFGKDDWIKIKILDSKRNIDFVKNSQKYIESVKNSKFKIEFLTEVDVKIKPEPCLIGEVVAKKSFMDRLFSKVKEDEQLKRLLDDIFH